MSDARERALEAEVAALLLDREEGGGVLVWARDVIAAGINAKHDGDCTNQSHACLRCGADEAIKDARHIIAEVRAALTTDGTALAAAIEAVLAAERNGLMSGVNAIDHRSELLRVIADLRRAWQSRPKDSPYPTASGFPDP